ncbi:threonine/serine exporter family protein [Macrococcus carouselicus]|uniref:Threonine/serine exporter n=1 Tax=Macrococcus carouselicus TaxID=69969 RepID=A0A9Q8CJ57_9STAP|nr:threonine/serine exporter family protein [Macrococcus carouselicus]TDM03670.1 threonine/serine exporter [Macrococcus carouselicus]
MNNADENTVLSVALLAGKILLESGAETYRVEDTMARIAKHYGLRSTHSFVTPTAIMFSASADSPSRLLRVIERTTDLQKIAETNEISRAITADTLSIHAAKEALEELDASDLQFNFWIKILAAALVSGLFLIMFNGSFQDMPGSIIAGGSGLLVAEFIQRHTRIKFFSEFAGAFVIALTALFFINYLNGVSLNKVIISGVMPLVPGVLITNAIRDLMAAHLLAGVVKGIEASLTAFAIGTGVAVCLILL